MRVKISYHKRFDKEGTVYSQAIRIDRKTLDSLNNAIHSEVNLNYPRKNEYSFTSGYETYLKPLHITDGKVVFMNNTTTRFVNLFLKLPLLDGRNSCLLINRL